MALAATAPSRSCRPRPGSGGTVRFHQQALRPATEARPEAPRPRWAPQLRPPTLCRRPTRSACEAVPACRRGPAQAAEVWPSGRSSAARAREWHSRAATPTSWSGSVRCTRPQQCAPGTARACSPSRPSVEALLASTGPGTPTRSHARPRSTRKPRRSCRAALLLAQRPPRRQRPLPARWHRWPERWLESRSGLLPLGSAGRGATPAPGIAVPKGTPAPAPGSWPSAAQRRRRTSQGQRSRRERAGRRPQKRLLWRGTPLSGQAPSPHPRPGRCGCHRRWNLWQQRLQRRPQGLLPAQRQPPPALQPARPPRRQAAPPSRQRPPPRRALAAATSARGRQSGTRSPKNPRRNRWRRPRPARTCPAPGGGQRGRQLRQTSRRRAEGARAGGGPAGGQRPCRRRGQRDGRGCAAKTARHLPRRGGGETRDQCPRRCLRARARQQLPRPPGRRPQRAGCGSPHRTGGRGRRRGSLRTDEQASLARPTG
mmetsp:Transcript_6119/g.25555  ORF Transcript_6119/g.25555 Transcript_6119/m.25555 type:complete len:484 (-) Transcript_6119:357-1808(-)